MDFKKVSKSIFTLTIESQYLDYCDKISVTDIRFQLKNEPGLIEIWKLYSENKRTTGGYYFTSKHIGGMDTNTKKNFRKNFESDLDACSEYILREIASILNLRVKFNN